MALRPLGGCGPQLSAGPAPCTGGGKCWRKLPERPQLHQPVLVPRRAGLDEASSPEDAEKGPRRLVSELEAHYPSDSAYLAEDLPTLWEHLHWIMFGAGGLGLADHEQQQRH